MPRQHLIAVLGTIAAVLAVALGVAVTLVLVGGDDESTTAGPATRTVTRSAIAPADPAAPAAPTTPTTTSDPAPVASGSAVVAGGPCLESEARSFGTDAAGQSLVCIYLGAGGGFQWVGHGDNSGEVHRIGEPCDSTVDKVAQDPDGRAIMCGGQTWVAGP